MYCNLYLTASREVRQHNVGYCTYIHLIVEIKLRQLTIQCPSLFE